MAENGFWEKVDGLLAGSDIIIDRPKGSRHPRYGFIYPLDYGFVKDTKAMDGQGIDVWRGSLSDEGCDALIVTVDLLKRDSEIKLLIGLTEAEKELALALHRDSVHMGALLVRRGDSCCETDEGGKP